MESPNNQMLPQKRSFWKMVKTMFIPAQTIAKLMVGCGGRRGKGKRRLTLRNMQQAKEAFMRASIHGAINRASSRRIQPVNRTSTDQVSNVESNSIDATNEVPVTLSSEVVTQQRNRTENETAGASNNLASALPAPTPLNLDEAEFLLESLTLNSQSSNSEGNGRNSVSNNAGFEVVSVEIVSGPHQESRNSISTFPINETHIIEEYNNSDEYERCHDESEDNASNGHRSRPVSLSLSNSVVVNSQVYDSNAVLPRSRTTSSFSSSVGEGNDFSGWKNSSIEVTSNPPVTLAFIPSGLCVGDRIVWVNDDRPEIGTVRWIGKIRQQFYAGVEFDKPVGNSSGIYGYGIGMYKRLFTCQLSYGRFVPVKELVLYKDYHDSGVKSGIVCIICRDDFLETWEPAPDALPGRETACGQDIQPSNMISTRCGHLFHWGCLDHWFSTQKRREYHCPFCSRSMERNEVIRIFPSQV